MTPRAKRVGWAVVVLLAVLVAAWAGPAAWESLAFEQEAVFDSHHTKDEYFIVMNVRLRVPRFSWQAPAAQPRLTIRFPRYRHWGVEGTASYSHEGVFTWFPPSGEVHRQFQVRRSRAGHATDVRQPPWPYPVLYSPKEVHEALRLAGQSVEAAAARGEITLPDWWEGAK